MQRTLGFSNSTLIILHSYLFDRTKALARNKGTKSKKIKQFLDVLKNSHQRDK